MTDRNKKIIIGSGLVLAVAVVVILIIKIFKKPAGELCEDGSPVPPNGICVTVTKVDKSGNKVIVTPKPDANGCLRPTAYSAAMFPLSLGMQGAVVKQWQKYVGTKQDGYFGCITLGDTLKKTGNATVSQDDFNAAIPKPAPLICYNQDGTQNPNGTYDVNGFPSADCGFGGF